MKTVEGLRVRFNPGEANLIDAYEFGYNFGCTLLDKERPKKKEKTGARSLVKCLVCGENF